MLSDGLADYLQYWLDAYAEQGLHNVLEDMHITDHVLVKLRRDRYYDALTIRLWLRRGIDGAHGGACAHCGAHVTAGEFDWVLSKIEQDDSYRG